MFKQFLITLLHPSHNPFHHTLITMTTEPVVSTLPEISAPAVSQPTSPPLSPPRADQFHRRQLPDTCIAFSSREGRGILREALEAGYMEGYFGLAAQFLTQDEPASSGLSTLVMVLNTLQVDPQRIWKGVWRWYHENMLDCCVPLTDASTKGITMDEFACIASCNTLNVNMVRAGDDSSETEFRSIVKKLTQCTDEVAVVSYSRGVLDQMGDGHFSPIGGYHPERDLVLVLDNARFKYPPHWVSLPLLFLAMKACDKDTGLPRGYLRLRRSETVPLVLFPWGPAVSQQLLDVEQQSATGFHRFIEAWSLWLLRPLLAEEEPIVEGALIHLLNALILQHKQILTTQINIRCPDMISAEHGCVVKDLLHSLQSIPIYKTVKEYLSKEPAMEILLRERGIVTGRITCKGVGERSQETGSVDNGGGRGGSLMAPSVCLGCEQILSTLALPHRLASGLAHTEVWQQPLQ